MGLRHLLNVEGTVQVSERTLMILPELPPPQTAGFRPFRDRVR